MLSKSLQGQTYLITGANTGAGFEASKLLLSKGAGVVMPNRNETKSAKAIDDTIFIYDFIYSLLSTPEQDKFQVKYEECAHSPHFEKPFDFYNEMTAFIERYK